MLWSDLDRFVCRARKLDTWTHLTPAHIEDMLKMDLSAGTFLPMDEVPDEDPVLRLAKSAGRMMHSFLISAVNDLETYGESALSRVVSENRTPQTVYFGRFGSDLYARRYNKLGSLLIQNKLFMLDVWNESGYDGESDVIRTEFSVSGDFLKRYSIIQDGLKIDDCRDLHLLDHVIPPLWNYLVTKWLSMRDINELDSNNRRWVVSESWQKLENAFGESLYDSERIHKRLIPRDDSHLFKQSLGCAISSIALRSSTSSSPDSVLSAMSSFVDDFIYNFNEDMQQKIDERVLEFGLDKYTDTALSALFRSERMIEGGGS